MATQALAYIESDVPEGMRLASWRAALTPRREPRRVPGIRIRPLSGLDSRR